MKGIDAGRGISLDLQRSAVLLPTVGCQAVSGWLRCQKKSRRSQGVEEGAGGVVVGPIGWVRCAGCSCFGLYNVPLFCFVLFFCVFARRRISIPCAAESCKRKPMFKRYCSGDHMEKFYEIETLVIGLFCFPKRYNSFVFSVLGKICMTYVPLLCRGWRTKLR